MCTAANHVRDTVVDWHDDTANIKFIVSAITNVIRIIDFWQ